MLRTGVRGIQIRAFFPLGAGLGTDASAHGYPQNLLIKLWVLVPIGLQAVVRKGFREPASAESDNRSSLSDGSLAQPFGARNRGAGDRRGSRTEREVRLHQ